MAVAVGIVATTLMMNDEKTKSQNFRLGLVGSAICSLLLLGYWLIFVSHSTLTSEAMLWAARLALVPVVAWLGSAFRAEWLGKTEKWLS